MQWSQYILVGFLFASLFFVAASLALYWAHKHGQLSNLERGSKSIFDEDEPMGEVTDQFPQRRERGRGGKAEGEG
jgi:nitrogen fixation-related uncharacterized protein